MSKISKSISLILPIFIIAGIAYAFTDPTYSPGSANSSSGSLLSQLVGANFDPATDSLSSLRTAVDSSGGGTTWSRATGNTTAAVNTSYMADSDSQITITLPASCSVGDTVYVKWVGTGGYILAAGAGDSIQIGSFTYSSLTGDYDMPVSPDVEVTCKVADTTWLVTDGGFKEVGADNANQLYVINTGGAPFLIDRTYSSATWATADSNCSGASKFLCTRAELTQACKLDDGNRWFFYSTTSSSWTSEAFDGSKHYTISCDGDMTATESTDFDSNTGQYHCCER